MGNVIRVSLPNPAGGYYNALTDPNLDHFSLYTDADNILIKEFARGGVITSQTGYEVTHNLGYVPMFLAFVKDLAGVVFPGSLNKWLQIGDANLVIAYGCISDINKLYIANLTFAQTQYVWYIFYDNVVGSSSKIIIESDRVLKVAKAGVNALTSVDPNDYIFHSDLNTFKIIKEGIATINVTGNGVYSFNHNAPISNPAAFLTYIYFPDGSVTSGNGTFNSVSRDGKWSIQSAIDSTQIINNIFSYGASGTIYVKYYIFETPLT